MGSTVKQKVRLIDAKRMEAILGRIENVFLEEGLSFGEQKFILSEYLNFIGMNQAMNNIISQTKAVMVPFSKAENTFSSGMVS